LPISVGNTASVTYQAPAAANSCRG
jgi:hypothetical protein